MTNSLECFTAVSPRQIPLAGQTPLKYTLLFGSPYPIKANLAAKQVIHHSHLL